MEHVVFYPAATGVPAFRRVGSLDEAVNFVEHLRNDENVTDFSVHELAPVQLSFRAYYHAQVPSTSPEGLAESNAPQLSVVPELAEPADAAAPVEAPAAEVSQVEAAVEVSAEQSAPVVEAVAEAPAVSEASAEGVTLAPIEATDEDRSAEWVAEATVVEAPVADVPAVEAPIVPGLAAEEPVAKPVLAAVEPIVESAPVAAGEPAAPAAEAAVQRTPFADAPPVSAPAVEADASDADAEPALETANADVIPALAPSGRRSLGFFAR
jgi:hypothetical protein